jgi:glycosyltransferase involved in cell wall biosynthesis
MSRCLLGSGLNTAVDATAPQPPLLRSNNPKRISLKANHMTGPIPRVSIGLPVYNGEKYLAAAIDSLLSQTFVDFELIISDNASTDYTADICSDYASRDHRIRYVRQPHNIGLWANFNRVFEMSRGELFRWHAADDVCASQFLERCVEVMDCDPNVVLCFSQTTIINGQGAVIFQSTPSGAIGTNPYGASEESERRRTQLLQSAKPHERFLGLLIYAPGVTEGFGLTRSAQLRQTLLHRPMVGSEKILLAELAFLGRFHELPESLFFSRLHENQCSQLPIAERTKRLEGAAIQSGVKIPPAVRCAVAHFGLPWKYPLTTYQRFRCIGAWMRYVMQMGKWQSVFREAFTLMRVSKSRQIAVESRATKEKQPISESSAAELCSHSVTHSQT